MSGFVTPTTPNLTDYATFLSNNGFSTAYLPANSPWITYAFNQAVALTLNVGIASSILYVLAVYNCAAHIQLTITPDLSGTATGSITGGVLTVTAISGYTITAGANITNVTALGSPITIVSYGTGTGGTGNYNVSNETITVSSTSLSIQNTYFSTLRSTGAGGYGLIAPINGVVSGSADEGTSQTLAVPDVMGQLTQNDLQFTKTPWGRYWLGYGQSVGPLWDLT